MRNEKQRYIVARLRPVNGVQIKRVVMPSLDRSILEVAAAVDLKDYRYVWFETVDMVTEYEKGMITYRPTIFQSTGKFFIDAYIEEYDDVLVNNKELAKQMTNLDWTHIARNIGVKNYWVEHFDPSVDELLNVVLP